MMMMMILVMWCWWWWCCQWLVGWQKQVWTRRGSALTRTDTNHLCQRLDNRLNSTVWHILGRSGEIQSWMWRSQKPIVHIHDIWNPCDMIVSIPKGLLVMTSSDPTYTLPRLLSNLPKSVVSWKIQPRQKLITPTSRIGKIESHKARKNNYKN